MKSIITVIGADSVGIIAHVSTFLASHKINIVDISQTTDNDCFLMVMHVDFKDADIKFSQASLELKAIGEKLGQRINMRHEQVFNSMHRI